jgi:hypothetical protein
MGCLLAAPSAEQINGGTGFAANLCHGAGLRALVQAEIAFGGQIDMPV